MSKQNKLREKQRVKLFLLRYYTFPLSHKLNIEKKKRIVKCSEPMKIHVEELTVVASNRCDWVWICTRRTLELSSEIKMAY